jgi:hypothetical protein
MRNIAAIAKFSSPTNQFQKIKFCLCHFERSETFLRFFAVTHNDPLVQDVKKKTPLEGGGIVIIKI